MADSRKAITANTANVTADMVAAIQAEGPMAFFQRVDTWLVKALEAELRDEAGLAPNADVDVHTARLALLRLWDASRRVTEQSTLLGSNLLQQYRVHALRKLADDPQVTDLLRAEFRANRNDATGVLDN